VIGSLPPPADIAGISSAAVVVIRSFIVIIIITFLSAVNHIWRMLDIFITAIMTVTIITFLFINPR
jgi:hypothetical protein